MSCQNQHFLCNFIPIGQLKDPFLDKQSPTIRMTLNILMTIRGFLNLSLKLKKKNQYLGNIAFIYAEKCGRIQVYILYRSIKCKTCTTMRNTGIRFFKLWHLFLSIQIVEHVFRNNLDVCLIPLICALYTVLRHVIMLSVNLPVHVILIPPE